MKKFILVILAVITAVCLWLGAAAAEEEGILGKPFPDFTAEDTQGNTFNLSEAVKDHEAVLINLWATWCPPCEREFPDLNSAFEEYGDRVAFIALSTEETDDLEKIEQFRTDHGVTFPMGRDEKSEFLNYTGSEGIPVTIIVDRFGNAVFERIGCFNTKAEITRTLDTFLGDSYTETIVLNDVPPESSTRAFPVSASRALVIENENVKQVFFRVEGFTDLLCYVIPDDTAHLRLEITAADPCENMIWYDGLSNSWSFLPELLNPERNAYIYDQPMPGAEAEEHFIYGCLTDGYNADDPDVIFTYLLAGEEAIEEFAEALRASGYAVSWEYTEPAQTEAVQPQGYILHAVDQDGSPVTGVYVNFCTDTACITAETDENGIITFTGEPDRYHVQILKVPDGYGFDADFELYTDSVYGEWMLRIRKDGGAA